METETLRTHLEPRLTTWRERLHTWGLDGLVGGLLEAAEPLSLLGAQVLYVAQPALGLLGRRAEAGHWARLLEDPANVAWLRERLTDSGEIAFTADGGEIRDDPAD